MGSKCGEMINVAHVVPGAPCTLLTGARFATEADHISERIRPGLRQVLAFSHPGVRSPAANTKRLE